VPPLRQRRLRRRRTDILSRPAALDQQRQKQNYVSGEDSEENLLEAFASVELRIAGLSNGSRKWIRYVCYIHCVFPEPMPSAPYARPALKHRNHELLNPPTNSAPAPSPPRRNPPAGTRAAIAAPRTRARSARA